MKKKKWQRDNYVFSDFLIDGTTHLYACHYGQHTHNTYYVFPLSKKANLVFSLFYVAGLEKYFYDNSDFYWSFDPENTIIRTVRSMNEGAKYAVDRHYHGRAIYTDGIDDWISLAKFGDDCIVNPGVCEGGFVLAMWVKMKDLYRGELCLVSTGAEVSSEFSSV